ncbi:MAG: hypothetical protein NTU94_09010 [Planctomycetota bacterium]|nr:hypothetical protein [Planctomycetota bacterium]
MATSFGGQGGEEAMAAMGVGMLLFFLFIMAVSVVLTIVIWWKIFSKAGWSGALGLLMLVPFVNLIMCFYVAFATWPIQRELEALKRGQK